MFSTKITGTTQVWRQNGPMAFPIQLTGGADATDVVGIAPDDSFVVVSRDVGGSENPGLYLLSPDGGPLTLIQHTPKAQAQLQFISDDSQSLYFRANDSDVDPASYALYRYEINCGKRERVFDTPGVWTIRDHRDGAWLLVKEVGNFQFEIYRYDVAARKLTPVIGQNELEDYDAMFGARRDQVLVCTSKIGNFRRLYSYEAGKLTPVTPDLKSDVARFTIDDARARIYYEINDNGYQLVRVLDANTGRPLALPKLPDADRVEVVNLSHNGRFVQLGVSSSQLPPAGVSIDWQTRKTTTWQAASTPEIDVKTFAKKSLEHYPARDGTKIPMFVRRPAKCDGPCPVIVFFHGGPDEQVTADFSIRGQIFVDAGFVFVEPNVRGSSGYGKAWMLADDGAKRLSVVTDIEDVARFIRASWGKDGKPPKIGVMGGRYGGYSTLMAMTYFAGAYDAGVQEVGISNFVSYINNTAPRRRFHRITEYGDPARDKATMLQLSPITHVGKLKGPLLSIQGVNDPRVPVGEAMQFHRELERRQVPGRGLMLFADEGHGVSKRGKRGNQVLAIGHTVAFFEKHLLGK